jgi:hypothetical protein
MAAFLPILACAAPLPEENALQWFDRERHLHTLTIASWSHTRIRSIEAIHKHCLSKLVQTLPAHVVLLQFPHG